MDVEEIIKLHIQKILVNWRLACDPAHDYVRRLLLCEGIVDLVDKMSNQLVEFYKSSSRKTDDTIEVKNKCSSFGKFPDEQEPIRNKKRQTDWTRKEYSSLKWNKMDETTSNLVDEVNRSNSAEVAKQKDRLTQKSSNIFCMSDKEYTKA